MSITVAHDYIFDRAERVIASAGLVIVPTETFYAIAADPFQEKAVQKIFRIKVREETKPLALIAADRSIVEGAISVRPGLTVQLMDRFWPGSLTILVQPGDATRFPVLVTGPMGKIGVRVPPWSAARILAARSGGWLTATSANRSGEAPAQEVSKIGREIRESVDMVMDLGPTLGGAPSTVVEPLDHGYRIVREGAIPESAIKAVWEELRSRRGADVTSPSGHPPS